ncbi:hypothetical protein FGO68_gene13423 [Halteria grandinella]|uniref:Golgin subfamily A member 7/ERF4 domain-containing protein n=1 Tax=Halteria grandinella TaxID=5974 RepID=A0A8J8P8K8_HALGN|nr:hypothetical protein FGO68_gene13423 [Halteria grandinella]
MDCVFNQFIPKSQGDLLVIRPATKTFVNGMAEAYSFEDYDIKLLEWNLSKRDYESMIERINNSIWSEYPCPGCQLFAYFCCLCTAGLSCVIPLLQVRQAMIRLQREIERVNQALLPRRMMLKHVCENSTSYILLYLPNHSIWQADPNINESGALKGSTKA